MSKKTEKLRLPEVEKYIKDSETRNRLLEFAAEVNKAAGAPDLGEYARSGGSYFTGVTAGFLGDYNPDDISLATYKKMRKDGQINAGLKVIKLPLKALPFYIECKDEIIKNAVYQALNRVWRSLIRSMLNALDFGFAPHEKVWEYVKGHPITNEKGEELARRDMWLWKKFKDVDPDTVNLGRNEKDEFIGFKQNQVIIPADKAFVFTNEKEFGNTYGWSILKPAYDYWYWSTLIYQFCNRYFEKRGTPTVKGRGPNKEIKLSSGEKIYGTDLVQHLGESLTNESVVTMPSDTDEKGNYLWDLEYLQSETKGEMFIRYIEHLNAMKLRSMFVPERTISQDTVVGSYSMAETHVNTFLMGLEGLAGDMEDQINRYAIRQFINFNFGMSAPDALIKIMKLSEQNRAVITKILEHVEEFGKMPIDWVRILEQLNVPLLKETDKAGTQDKDNPGPLEKHRHNVSVNFASKGKYWRALHPREKGIDLEGIEDFLNKQEEKFISDASGILTQQKELYLIQLDNILKSSTTLAQKMREINLLTVKYQGKYEDMITANLMQTIEYNLKQAAKELKIKPGEIPAEVKAWVRSMSHTTVTKHLAELNAQVTYPALNGLNMKLSTQEILFNTQEAFDKFIERRSLSLAQGLSGLGVNRGREIARIQSGDTVAAFYSAILDRNTCDLCASLDGKTIDINDPDYYRFPAGDIHDGCRCMWIYITKEEDPENYKINWETPPQGLVDKYYNAV